MHRTASTLQILVVHVERVSKILPRSSPTLLARRWKSTLCFGLLSVCLNCGTWDLVPARVRDVFLLGRARWAQLCEV